MKTIPIFCNVFLLLGFASLCQAQQSPSLPAPTKPTAVMRDGNTCVWQWTEYEQGPNGQPVARQHHYDELATGLNFKDPATGQWVPSKEEIDILSDGSAQAVQGQHKAYFPPDIYNGVIKLVTLDGLQLQSQPIALSYDDGTNTVIIAVLTNAVGELISSNQITYPNAFEGISTSLIYTYKKSGFEQDVLLQEQPPAPEQFGLNSAYTHLQLLTEFFNSPTPIQDTSPGTSQSGLQDTTLTFGQTTMGHGRAFLTGAASSQKIGHGISICKSWVNSDGRTLLVEEVPYQIIYPELATLPSQPLSTMNLANPVLHKVSSRWLLPPARLAAATTNRVQLARADSAKKSGVVFDYVTINANETNFTFQGDSTFFLSGPFYLVGKITIEGGAILKMTNFYSFPNAMINIDQNSSVNCETAPYRPAVFTSMDDNTLGETISGSTGSPSIEENNYYLMINSNSLCIHDCRFSYALLALSESGAGYPPATINITNCQFENTEVAVLAHDIGLYNVLIGTSTNVYSQILSDDDPQIYLEGTNLIAENVTADSGYAFIQADQPNEVMALTNCLITSQPLIEGNTATFNTNAVVWLQTLSSPIYQTVGGGNYYLATNSPGRQAGTTNIDPTLLADLAEKTTWPPIVYDATNISSLGTLSIAAWRDTNVVLDIGYHYDPLDYAFGGCGLNTNMTVTAGTVAGWFLDGSSLNSSQPYGISLNDYANLSFK